MCICVYSKASFSPELSQLNSQISELHDEMERMRLEVASNINLEEKKVWPRLLPLHSAPPFQPRS